MLFLISTPTLVINCHNLLAKNLLNSTQRLVLICCQSKLLSIANSKSFYSTKVNAFESMVEREKQSAKNYVLLEDRSKTFANIDNKYFSDLFNGELNNVWKYSYEKKVCALIELKPNHTFFSHSKNYICDQFVFPVNTRMMYFCPKTNNFRSKINNDEKMIQLKQRRNDEIIDFNSQQMRQFCESNDKLINFLLDGRGLTELDVKLRFFVVNQLEELLCGGYFNAFKLLPFGSSLSGLGNLSSDLDLVLKNMTDRSQPKSQLTYAYKDSERSETQQIIEIAADLIQHLTPNFSRVHRILRARIPIIKFKFDLAPIDIDLSAEVSNHHHGFVMAEYLSYCNSANSCVRKLILLIRFWAKQHGLTRSQPGHWFSNFQLTSLVLYYLQTLNIVPPMAAFTDKTHLDFELNYGMEFDIIDLLHNFFQFMLHFNNDKYAISLVYGKTIQKPTYTTLYIENPCERELNVCHNVNAHEYNKFLFKVKEAVDIMKKQPVCLADIFNSTPESGKNTFRRALSAQQLLFDE